MKWRVAKTAILLMCVLASALALGAASASALSPWWHLTSGSRPTDLRPGGEGNVVVTVANLGDEDADGATNPIAIRDLLPSGLQDTGEVHAAMPVNGILPKPVCSASSQSLVVCSFEHGLPPYAQIELVIAVKVSAEAASSRQVNEVEVSGGGALSATLRRPLTISEAPTPFGVEDYEMALEEEGGGPDTRAGSHPFQFTTTIALNQNGENEPAAMPKDLNFKLPPGLIGNPSVFARCTLAQFSAPEAQCSPQSVVGAAIVTFIEPGVIGVQTDVAPVYNLEPNVGEPARFGFRPAQESAVYVDTSVRTGSDYGVTAEVRNITQLVGFLSSKVTLWGVPGVAAHDDVRGTVCILEAFGEPQKGQSCRSLDETKPPPFFVTPTSCPRNHETGMPEPLSTSVEGDSWTHPGVFQSFPGAPMQAMDDCNQLPFSPRIEVAPSAGAAASSPTGLNVDVHVNQESVLDSESLAESAVKQITVALPPGVAINPAGGDGLQACSEGEIGFTGGEADGALTFTPTEPSPFCPDAAKVGTVEIVSPLLPPNQHLHGSVYIANQNENPFGSLIAMYIVAEDPISGVLVKLPGEVRLCEGAGEVLGGVSCGAPGQIVSTFKDTPQLAFEDAKIEFFGGERAPLASPARCGAYETTASFVPWAAEPSDEAAVTVPASSTFDITSGPHGSPCPGASLPFSPSLKGGSKNINAGSFTELTTTIGREDGEQNMAQVVLHFPPGLSGRLSNVALCGEQQANEGKCPESSLIGETTVSAGVGSDPVSVTGGKVYITEKYHGAPFGLSIVNPVKAGPFDLEKDTSNPNQDPACDCLVVRARVEVDPHTAALTVTTNSESEGYAIPHMIDGIPVQIKKVNVLVDREHFTFNPTSCEQMKITGEIKSDEGASSPVSVPLQVTNCAALKFEPKLTVSTSGKTSKADGASLTLKFANPSTPQGTEANLAKFKVELPEQLPSRLTTLQKACTAAQFNANPAGCPSASVVGHMKVLTPLLPVPVEGPMYFVSNGGEAFPNLIIVLQGYGVTVDLIGDTFISKTGVTSSTFKAIPDVPFSSAEVTLPEGPYSALAANGNLCAETLAMPTEFIAQNGAPIHESTPIQVTGCPPAITVVSHKVKGDTATIEVKVPVAGKLVATARGLSKASGRAKGAGTLTIKLQLTKGEAAFLRGHHGRRLKAKIQLTFAPKKGAKLHASTTVAIG